MPLTKHITISIVFIKGKKEAYQLSQIMIISIIKINTLTRTKKIPNYSITE
jgi:hypothetical protein